MCFFRPLSAKLSILAVLCLLVLQSCLLNGGNKGGGGGNLVHRGYYTVTNPTLGSYLNLDSTYQILWTKSDSVTAAFVNIYLYHLDTLMRVLAYSTPNSGSYPWIVRNSRAGSGTGYHLKVVSSTDTTQWDISYDFVLHSDYSGTLSVTGPTAGTVAQIDSTLAIRWLSTGKIGSEVSIQLLKDATLTGTIAYLAPNTGSYTWSRVVTGVGSGSNYHVKISSISDPAISGYSPAFTIKSSYSGTIEVTAPKAGDSLRGGDTYTISWTITGNPGTTGNIFLCQDSVTISAIGTYTNLAAGSLGWSLSPGTPTSNRYRIKMTSTQDPGIIFYSGYFSITGVSPDVYENDDSLKVAKTITTDGTWQSHTLTTNNPDWLQFTATAGQGYLAMVKSSGSMYLTCYLYDSLGLFLSSKSGYQIQLITTPTMTGKYYLKITSTSGFGPYTVALNRFDSSPTGGFPAKFTTPDSATTWAAGSNYSITWIPDSLYYGMYISLGLFLDTTLVQSIITNQSNTGNYSWTLPAGVATSDRYRIKLWNSNTPQIYGYSSRFSVSGVTPDTYEPDNARATAKAIAADGNSQSHTLTTGDNDWLQFSSQPGKKYLLAVKAPTTQYLYAFFVDSIGNSLTGSQYGNQFQLLLNPTYTGKYYVHITQYSAYTGPYSLSLFAYDSTQSNLPIRFSIPDSATVWAAGSTYSITWTPDSLLYGTYVNLQLYRDTTLVQNIANSSLNNGSYSWTVPAGIMTSDRYRIRMLNGANSQIYGYSGRFTLSGINPDSYEPDNSRGTAKVIPTNGTLQARTLTTSDPDWVKFAVQAGQSYWIKATTTSYTSLTVYADSVSAFALVSVDNVNPSSLLTATASGTYYMQISTSNSANYSLSVRVYQPDSIVKFFNPTESSIFSAGSPYVLSWQPDAALSSGSVYFYLFKGNTQITNVAYTLFSTGTANWTVPAGLASGSDYQIHIPFSTGVTAFSPKFTVSGMPADSLEANDSAAAARLILPNVGRRQLSLTYGDKDWFKFNAKAKMVYVLQTEAATTLNHSISLYNGVGASMIKQSTRQFGDTLNTLAWFCPADGINTLSILPTSASYSGVYNMDFKVYGPSEYQFLVSAPLAGVALKYGQTMTIKWSNTADIKGTVDLFLFNSAGVAKTIAASVPNTGNYTWTIDATLLAGTDYYVKVSSLLGSDIAGNSGVFSVGP